MEELASRLTPEDRVVMESTGSVWSNLYDLLEERKVPTVLANPLRTRAIASARIKTDNHNEPYISIASQSPFSILLPLFLKRLAYNHSGICPIFQNSPLRGAFPIQVSGMSPNRSSREIAPRRSDSS